jgi:hypothetical protein
VKIKTFHSTVQLHWGSFVVKHILTLPCFKKFRTLKKDGTPRLEKSWACPADKRALALVLFLTSFKIVTDLNH